MNGIAELLSHWYTWVITVLASFSVIGTLFHNYLVRKYLREIRDALRRGR